MVLLEVANYSSFDLGAFAFSFAALMGDGVGGSLGKEPLVGRGQHVNRHNCLPFGQIV